MECGAGYVVGGERLLMANRKMSPQRAELYRLREYGKKLQTLKRAKARRSKVATVASFGGKS